MIAFHRKLKLLKPGSPFLRSFKDLSYFLP